jgi:uncharacterized protein
VKLHLGGRGGGHVFSGYGADFVLIDGEEYRTSLILTRDQILTPWRPRRFDDLTPQDFDPLLALSVAVVLLGTGSKARFPAPQTMRPLVQAQIGYEVMDTHATCRTFNILMDEGRSVAAALILDTE